MMAYAVTQRKQEFGDLAVALEVTAPCGRGSESGFTLDSYYMAVRGRTSGRTRVFSRMSVVWPVDRL